MTAFAELRTGSRFKLDPDGPVLIKLASRPNGRFNARWIYMTHCSVVQADYTGWLEIGEFRQVYRL
jgi:hypothetical protein